MAKNCSLLTKREAADRARISERNLERRIKLGTGPKVTRIGRRVLIRAGDYATWIDAQAKTA